MAFTDNLIHLHFVESFLTTVARLMAEKDLPALMLVDDESYRTLDLTKFSSSPLATPGVIAMIALKFHAIYQPSRTDVEKDWSEVCALVKAHHLSRDDAEFYATVLKHGGRTAIARIRTTLAGRN